MSLVDLLILCTGGALGAVARYWVCRLGALAWPKAAFPAPTLFVNISGSALLGVLFSVIDPDLTALIDAPIMLFGAVGFCGAYTTFSSFCTDTVALISRSLSLAVLYVVTTVAGAILAFVAAFTFI